MIYIYIKIIDIRDFRGCSWNVVFKGHVVGWSEIADETPAPEGVVCNELPAVVYVKFETATSWQIPGMPDSNVYPVAPCRRVWYLDRQRQSPKLRVSRTQFPLAPQFTAHVAQGQTIKEGVMTDLCIGPMGNPFTVYVAITRVQGRGKLLIFRPFDAAPFQKGIGLGRDLLLRHLRGDAINWQALLVKYCEERVCSTCAERKQSTAFTPGQWKRSDTDRVCRECTKHYADAGTPWQCNVCKLWHVETNLPEKHRQRQCSFFPCLFDMRSQEAMFQMRGSQGRERLWPCCLESSPCWPTLLPQVRPEAAGVLVLRRMFRAEATRRVYGLARKPRLQSRWHAVLQHVHQFSLGVSNCPSRERTVDTATAAREKSTATGHHRRSAPRNSGKDQAENHDCVHPRHAKLQRPIARLRHRFRAPWGCHRKRSQPRGTTPTRARCDSKERQTDPLVPMSILPATCEKHCGDWANWSLVRVRKIFPCRWRLCHRPHSQTRVPNVRNNRLLRKGRWPNQSQAQKLCWTRMPPGKLERDGNAGLITLLVSNLLASLCRSLSSCPASRLESAKRHCLNPQAWPAFLHCMPTANLLMSSWSWLSICPASKTSISEPCRRAKTPWQWRTSPDCQTSLSEPKLALKPVAGLKHHGSEGRIGPAARTPDCQTSLSEPTRN